MPMGVGLLKDPHWQRKFNQVLAELKDILGHAPAWNHHTYKSLRRPPRIVDNHVTGSVPLIKLFAQMFMYTWASNITYMRRLSADERLNWASWVYYARRVQNAPSVLAAKGALIAKRVLEDLGRDDANGLTTILAGHDTNEDELKVLFQLPDYAAPPFVTEFGATPPGSAFVFTKEGDKVFIDFLYTAFNGSTNAPQRLQRVETTSLEDLWKRYNAVLRKYPNAKRCALGSDDAAKIEEQQLWNMLPIPTSRSKPEPWPTTSLVVGAFLLLAGATVAVIARLRDRGQPVTSASSEQELTLVTSVPQWREFERTTVSF